jgi:hypothetical protein
MFTCVLADSNVCCSVLLLLVVLWGAGVQHVAMMFMCTLIV